MLDLLITYPLKGPLVARMELAAGRSSTGGNLIDGTGWVSGVRLGLGAETPVGPVRFEYGLAEQGREAFFVRLGRWF
jgi:NTE family protein